MKLSPKEKLGEDLILEIFDDGILILTNQNEFQVLFFKIYTRGQYK